MNISRLNRHQRINALLYRHHSMRPLRSTKKSSRGLKAALIGLLLICVSLTTACVSSLPQVERPKVSVDASLMVEQNYTQQLLKALSQ